MPTRIAGFSNQVNTYYTEGIRTAGEDFLGFRPIFVFEQLCRCPQGCPFHPRPASTEKPSGLHPWFTRRGAQARWLSAAHGQPSSVSIAPLCLMYSAVVPKGALSIQDHPKPKFPLVSILGSHWCGAQAGWLNANRHADAAYQQDPILSMVPTLALLCFSWCPFSQRQPSLLVTQALLSARWSPPVVVIGVVLMIIGSLSASTLCPYCDW